MKVTNEKKREIISRFMASGKGVSDQRREDHHQQASSSSSLYKFLFFPIEIERRKISFHGFSPSVLNHFLFPSSFCFSLHDLHSISKCYIKTPAVKIKNKKRSRERGHYTTLEE
jgi:hypothetical protein